MEFIIRLGDERSGYRDFPVDWSIISRIPPFAETINLMPRTDEPLIIPIEKFNDFESFQILLNLLTHSEFDFSSLTNEQLKTVLIYADFLAIDSMVDPLSDYIGFKLSQMDDDQVRDFLSVPDNLTRDEKSELEKLRYLV